MYICAMKIKDYLDELTNVEKPEGFDSKEWSRSVLAIKSDDQDKVAVKVGSIRDEYVVLSSLFPNHEHIGQALFFNEENGVRTPYDQHTIKYNDEQFQVLFDISHFFGK